MVSDLSANGHCEKYLQSSPFFSLQSIALCLSTQMVFVASVYAKILTVPVDYSILFPVGLTPQVSAEFSAQAEFTAEFQALHQTHMRICYSLYQMRMRQHTTLIVFVICGYKPFDYTSEFWISGVSFNRLNSSSLPKAPSTVSCIKLETTF